MNTYCWVGGKYCNFFCEHESKLELQRNDVLMVTNIVSWWFSLRLFDHQLYVELKLCFLYSFTFVYLTFTLSFFQCLCICFCTDICKVDYYYIHNNIIVTMIEIQPHSAEFSLSWNCVHMEWCHNNAWFLIFHEACMRCSRVWHLWMLCSEEDTYLLANET